MARIGNIGGTQEHHTVKVDFTIRKSPKNKIIIWMILELHADVAFA